MSWRMIILTLSILGLLASTAAAQLSQTAGAASVAGTLQKSLDDADEYEFDSRGNQVLFADLDADIYINRTPHDSHETGSTQEAVTVSCGTSHDQEDGEDSCGGEGNGRFLLEVLSMDQELICQAGKPARPGWDTDPRMACFLAQPGVYILQVRLAGTGGHDGESSSAGKIHPYLLNISLRNLAPDFPGIKLDKAVKESVNRLPFNK